MTGPDEATAEVTAALHRLAGDVRGRVPVAPATAVRARAVRQQRIRRTGLLLTAAAAVAAVAIGGTGLLQPIGGPPISPADTPPPTLSPSPDASPVPPPVHHIPSPRAVPPPSEPLDDPITEVDWSGEITIDVPHREGCPSGALDFRGGSHGTVDGSAPGMALAVAVGGGQVAAYGDVTGDGRAEAIIGAMCFSSPEQLTSGHGWQLLVVARSATGALTGVGWVGPFNANIQTVWVDDGRILMDGDPSTAGPEDYFPALPGLALSYRFDGTRFVGWEPATDYPPVVALAPDQPGAPVQPHAVAAGLGCPDRELHFTRVGAFGGVATAGDVTFTIPDRHHPAKQHLFDLDKTGQRLLVTALACTDADGWTREGLAVFERAGDGWQGISVLAPPDGYGMTVDYWTGDEPGHLTVVWRSPDESAEPASIAYRWNGTLLEPVAG